MRTPCVSGLGPCYCGRCFGDAVQAKTEPLATRLAAVIVERDEARARVAPLAAAIDKAAAVLSWWRCGEDCPHKYCEPGCDGRAGAECRSDLKPGETPGGHEPDCPPEIVRRLRAALVSERATTAEIARTTGEEQ